MPAIRLDGKAMAEKILLGLKQKIAVLPQPPGLAVIMLGNNPASILYVKNKERAAHQTGMAFHLYRYNDQGLPGVDQAQVISALAYLNRDPAVHGVIVQLPVPDGFDADALVAAVDPKKDVDGFHPVNVERFLGGKPYLTPPVLGAVLRLLDESGVTAANPRVLILAKDGVLRKTLGKVLVDHGARVTAATLHDSRWVQAAAAADVVISAVGQPGVITGGHLKPGAVVIDVGITRLPNGKFAGDVDASTIEKVAAVYTPTPGGVGPLTVALLLQNVAELARRQTTPA